jgi:hypothetical protein
MEAGKFRNEFIERDVEQIMEDTLDVTYFFEKKESSIKRLKDALRRRPVYPGLKEREEILKKGKELREKI